MSLSAGDRLGRYEILGPLGAGGMGEVYRARDTELERDVAVKVLPEAVSQNPDRLARFEREAKAVAKLSHPNILEIHDYGRDGDITYAVTELLEGRTLRETLAGRPMPWQKAAEIGARVADGLAAAHDKSVVHRDLKPSNIFVCSDGRVKILDFGLASVEKAVDFEADTRSMEPPLTREGGVMGTVGYMSPEQARGRHADHRSDIFSLGCVLYEMVSGRGPFDRESSADTFAAILKEEPPPLSESAGTVGPEVSKTIERCLEKEPERRFQSASDLAYNLRTVSGASAPAVERHKPSIAGRRKRTALIGIGVVIAAAVVLTFVLRGPPSQEKLTPLPEVSPNRVAVAALENRTGDPSLDALGVMAVDEITQRVTQVGVAEIVPITDELTDSPSTGPGANRPEALTRILGVARQKGAAFLLFGDYYLDGENLRLQARYVETATGDLIWAFDPLISPREFASEAIETLGERALVAVAAHHPPGWDLRVSMPPSNYEAWLAFSRAFQLINSPADVPCVWERRNSSMTPSRLSISPKAASALDLESKNRASVG